MNYKDELLNRINKLLSGEWNVPEFQENYYMYFLESVPFDSLSDSEQDFFSFLQEQLDWTDPNPDEESRRDGWRDEREYIELVRRNLTDFLADENKWHEAYKGSWGK